MDRHTWSHYKGGDYVCSACGSQKEPEEREPGARTLIGHEGLDPRQLLDELRAGEEPSWLAEPGPSRDS